MRDGEGTLPAWHGTQRGLYEHFRSKRGSCENEVRA